MEKYCPEYLAYCSAHGKTPDEMMAHDAQEYPGGKMCGFILWVQRICNEFRRAHPECCIGDSIRDQDAKVRFMQKTAKEERTRHEPTT